MGVPLDKVYCCGKMKKAELPLGDLHDVTLGSPAIFQKEEIF